MKKSILTFFAIIGLALTSFGQSLAIESYDKVTPMDPDTIVDYGAHVIVKNISSATVKVLCKRTEFGDESSWCAISGNYFCWDLCYGNETDLSIDGWDIAPGATNNAFSGHAYSSGNGTNCADSVRYTFFVDFNPNDSVSVVLKFENTASFSISEQSIQKSNAYPNPARNYFFVELAHQPKANTTIEVYNLLGSKVRSVAARSTKVEVNVADLKSGIYLYTITENGRAIETKKIVVKN